MTYRSGFAVYLLCSALLLAAGEAQSWANNQVPAAASAPAPLTVWQPSRAEHAYGLPEVKPGKDGKLTLTDSDLVFAGKDFRVEIPRAAISAVSAGGERMELWGTGGRLLRMAIPQGGGLAAATVLHHRVDMLTVEFRDSRGGQHATVFKLPGGEAAKALPAFGHMERTPVEPAVAGACGDNPIDPQSVLVEMPNWERADVPAAYRALVYEHVIDRLRAVKGVRRVYRAGEVQQGTACPQTVIRVAVQSYTKGNQIVRAATGPIGMFTSATKMSLQVEYSDTLTKAVRTEEIKAAVRTESESTGIADSIAKKVAKQYTALTKLALKRAAA